MAITRENEDIKRDLETYKDIFKFCGYTKEKIIAKLAKDKKSKNNSTGTSLLSDIAKKWGYKGDDSGLKFIKRVLNYFQDTEKTLPVLSRSKLVHILCNIQKYYQNEHKVLNKMEIVRILKKHGELTRNEKKKLHLPVDLVSFVKDNYIDKKSLFTVAETGRGSVDESIDHKNDPDLKKIIVSVLRLEIQNKNLAEDDRYIQIILEKVTNQINSIKVQSGLGNISKLNNVVSVNNRAGLDRASNKIFNTVLPTESLRELIKNIIINTELTKCFSIELEHIEVHKKEFLPVETKDDNQIINHSLLKYDNNSTDIERVVSVFKNKHTYVVKVKFCLNIVNDKSQPEKIYFTEEVRGTSSIISLIRKALNRAIFWDIDCLRDFFPVAQEIFLEDQLFFGHSLAAVLSKSRVRLVKLDDLQELLEEQECIKYFMRNQSKTDEINEQSEEAKPVDFDCYVEGSDVVDGSYCGFDLIESIALSGFFARLKLLQELNIDPKTYMRNIVRRIREQKHLTQGRKYLRSYPFSLLAMENYLTNEILKKGGYFNQEEKRWSNVAYQAFFDIIGGYLNEGLYHAVGDKLKQLESHQKYFSHFFKADYYLCQAEYAFLSENNIDENSRRENIDECIKYIDHAENELKLRVLEFFRIGELSQGNLSPLFSYWARIYALKGRLNLFFPGQLNQNTSVSVSELLSTLIYLGNARINSARDGNSDLASEVAAYQSWAYFIQAYLGDQYQGLRKEECITWAKKLINHTLIGFQNSSDEAYKDYMETIFSEYTDKNDLYQLHESGLEIQRPAFIRLLTDYNLQKSQPKDERDSYNISSKLIKRELIQISDQDATNSHLTLFGQHSAYYFFAYAMMKLCDDYPEKTNISEIYKNFEKAFDYFYCSFSIAFGGAELNNTRTRLNRNSKLIPKGIDQPDNFVIDRFNVSSLKGLYFHRIVELVDLSRIFASLTISMIAQDEAQLEIGRKLLGDQSQLDVITNVPGDFEKIAYGQRKYNIHLKKRFSNVKRYLLENCLAQTTDLLASKKLLDYRDERVRKVFQKLRGD